MLQVSLIGVRWQTENDAIVANLVERPRSLFGRISTRRCKQVIPRERALDSRKTQRTADKIAATQSNFRHEGSLILEKRRGWAFC